MSAQTEVRSTGKSDEQLLVEALDRQIIHRRVSEEELARALELLGQSGREVIAGLVERHGHPKALRQAFARGAARTSGAMRAALMDLGASDYFALRREVAPKVARKRSREWFFSCRREARRDGVSETALEEAIELVGRDVILQATGAARSEWLHELASLAEMARVKQEIPALGVIAAAGQARAERAAVRIVSKLVLAPERRPLQRGELAEVLGLGEEA